MKCSEVKSGSYNCVYNIMPPFPCGMLEKKYRYVSIDKCLIHEIINLWEQGIKTTGCCCGHGDNNKAYIGVEVSSIPKMKKLGYTIYYNPCRPKDEDSFVPKTILLYGTAKNNK